MHRHFELGRPLQRVRIILIQIDEDKKPPMRRQHAKQFSERAILIGVVIKRLDR